MSSFRQIVNVRRPVAGSWTKGRFIPGVGSVDFTILASIQPLRPSELDSLPEGRRESTYFRLYTATNLVMNDETDLNTQPDIVELYGEDYEIVQKAIWQNNVINHYKYIVAKIIEGE